MQDGGHDAFQKPEDTTEGSVFTCAARQLRCDYLSAAGIRRARCFTIRVDAVERRWRDDGHFTLTQRTLRGQLLLTAGMHLQDRGTP